MILYLLLSLSYLNLLVFDVLLQSVHSFLQLSEGDLTRLAHRTRLEATSPPLVNMKKPTTDLFLVKQLEDLVYLLLRVPCGLGKAWGEDKESAEGGGGEKAGRDLVGSG